MAKCLAGWENSCGGGVCGGVGGGGSGSGGPRIGKYICTTYSCMSKLAHT